MPEKERATQSRWNVDLNFEPWRDRIITLLCGMGLLIPVGRGYQDKQWPWEWTGDRIAVAIIFIALGVLCTTLTSED